MVKRIMKKIYKMGGVILVMVLGSSFNGCSELGSIKSDSDYKNLALETLEDRYGEKFEIKQLGGTFGALNDTKKLVCYPSSNPDKYCFVEVEKDLSEVHDNYINRIMEGKLNQILTPIAKEIFGEEVKVQSFFDNRYNEYDSLDISVVDFMNNNSRCSYVLDIFINGGENLDKVQEAEKIEKFMKKLLDDNINNNNFISFWYIKSGVDEELNNYYDLRFNNQVVEYFEDENLIYNTTFSAIRQGEIKYPNEDVQVNFKY